MAVKKHFNSLVSLRPMRRCRRRPFCDDIEMDPVQVHANCLVRRTCAIATVLRVAGLGGIHGFYHPGREISFVLEQYLHSAVVGHVADQLRPILIVGEELMVITALCPKVAFKSPPIPKPRSSNRNPILYLLRSACTTSSSSTCEPPYLILF